MTEYQNIALSALNCFLRHSGFVILSSLNSFASRSVAATLLGYTVHVARPGSLHSAFELRH